MAERRFERDLRTMLAQDLDGVHGPHPRWADAPVARRVAASSAPRSRWRALAALVAATMGLVVLALAVGLAPREMPVASAPPSIEPWPSAIAPSATPTTGEIALGRVAVVVEGGRPVLLVRVAPAITRALGESIRIEIRVIGRLDRPVGAGRFLVIRGGTVDPSGLGAEGPDRLAIAAGAEVGTEVAAGYSIARGAYENVDLGFAGGETSVTFHYPIHRAPPPPSLEGRCPTLEDYAIASLQPSAEPARPSFDPVAPEATPSTGMLALGDTGILAAPDGSPGALVRVTNARFCDRLPDIRPDSPFGPSTLLLADVEIDARKAGTVEGLIPGTIPVAAAYAGAPVLQVLAWGMPGFDSRTHLGGEFTYRGTMVWDVPTGSGRVTVDVRPSDPEAQPAATFSFLVRDGSLGPPWPGSSLAPTSDPAAATTSGGARPGEQVILAADGGTMPVVVGGIDQVARYPGLLPAVAGDVFLEFNVDFGRGSGTFGFEPDEWVVVGPDGALLGPLQRPNPNEYPHGWPLVDTLDTYKLDPGIRQPSLWMIVEAPPSGRVTLEYRPASGPALVTWVLRER
jgi:hypothetical protein